MKVKYTLILLIVLLLGSVAAGMTLNSDLTGGPRNLHRIIGLLAGIVAAIAVVQVFITKTSTAMKTFAVIALLLTGIAGYSGDSLKSTSNYDKTFNKMRASGLLAVLASVGALVQTKAKSPKIEPPEDKV